MPRQPRLDGPGTLHHVIGRGIEGTEIFRNEGDKKDFVSRVAELCQAGFCVKIQTTTMAFAIYFGNPNSFPFTACSILSSRSLISSRWPRQISWSSSGVIS